MAVYDSEGRARRFHLAHIVFRPIPKTNPEAHFSQTRCTPFDRLVQPEHLGEPAN